MLLSIRFDSARSLIATSTMLDDVVSLGGRVHGFRNDTLLIEPYYVTIYDASRDDRERAFYRGGSYRLPELAIVLVGPDVVVSQYITPAARKSRGLENAVTVAVDVFPVLLFLNGLKPFLRH